MTEEIRLTRDIRKCKHCGKSNCQYLFIKKKDFVYCCLHVPSESIDMPIYLWICPNCVFRMMSETWPEISNRINSRVD